MVKLLLYCTKSKIRLFFDKLKEIFTLGKIPSNNDLNGKIVAECDFEVENILFKHTREENKFGNYKNKWWHEYKGLNTSNDECDLLLKSCLTWTELENYLQNKNGYAIHIKNLNIFDTPRELSDYYTFDGKCEDINNWRPIKKAPQNMMYAYEYIVNFGCIEIIYINLNKNILISIHPEWLCKILNGEKTIEFRKKVLKGMLENGNLGLEKPQ